MTQNINKPFIILRPAQVSEKKGIPRTTQNMLLKAGDFPKPIKLSGSRTIGFIESEIDEWITKRMVARDATHARSAAERLSPAVAMIAGDDEGAI